RRAGPRVVADPPSPRRPRHPAPHADEAEVAVHRPLLLVDARLQELARALLGAALAAWVVRRARDDRPAGLVALERLLHRRQDEVPQQRNDDDSDGDGSKQHRAVLAVPETQAPPAARGKKMTRSASRGICSNALTIRASRRPAALRSGTVAHMP